MYLSSARKMGCPRLQRRKKIQIVPIVSPGNNIHSCCWRLWVTALQSYQLWIPSFTSAESEMGEPGEVIAIIHLAWGGNSSKLWNPHYQGHSIFIGRHPISVPIARDKNNFGFLCGQGIRVASVIWGCGWCGADPHSFQPFSEKE